MPCDPDMHTSASPPQPGGDGVILSFRDIHKAFKIGRRSVPALRGVNLDVRTGTITGLIGPDGAGKTTLMRLATGLLAPDAGRVTVLGMDATRQSLAVQATIGYMPQRFGLYEDLTVRENLDLYADLQGVPEQERPARYAELMRMTGLDPFMSRLAGRLSGGMKQKLGLACTLVHPPRLLLLDEPTVGVDPVSRRELWAIINRLVRQEGTSVLMSTSYLDEAERCDEVVMLHEGQVLGRGTPGSFSAQLEGRTYMLAVPAPQRRRVQEALARHPQVVDSLLVGDTVRLVMEAGAPPRLEALLPGQEAGSLEPVRPRFEDSFVATLRARRPQQSRHGAEPAAGLSHSPAGGAGGNVIQVRDLQRRFGSFYAVKRVTFDVARGEVFGLLGANGAGKSTTFRMLCGLLPPSAGSLSVAGMDLRHAAPAARARIGYMSQKFSLYGNLTAWQNLSFFSRAYGLSGRRRSERISWALDEFGLGPLADAASSDLPLGYKQRLAMACALMHEPEILFLDEPTSGVDPLARREFWSRMNALAEQGVTVMVTTHFMQEAEYCDRLAIMSAGEILALGTPTEIRAGARTPALPEPTMEDAFVSLIQAAGQPGGAS
jgi:ABC-2 type transport system ATP-binding protein